MSDILDTLRQEGVDPARKIRIGNKLFFDESGNMVAEVIDNTTSRGRTLRFLYDCPHDEFKRDSKSPKNPTNASSACTMKA